MLPRIWASFMIHDDPSSARVVHPYLIGDELVGDGIPTRFVTDIAAEDVMTAAAMAPAALRRIRDLVLPEPTHPEHRLPVSASCPLRSTQVTQRSCSGWPMTTASASSSPLPT
jgi:hypothetical protein